MVEYDENLKRKNKRMAWGFAAFSVIVLLTSFPFWMNVFKTVIQSTP